MYIPKMQVLEAITIVLGIKIYIFTWSNWTTRQFDTRHHCMGCGTRAQNFLVCARSTQVQYIRLWHLVAHAFLVRIVFLHARETPKMILLPGHFCFDRRSCMIAHKVSHLQCVMSTILQSTATCLDQPTMYTSILKKEFCRSDTCITP